MAKPAGLADKQRADLVAIFLTGLPAGIVPGFQNVTAGGKVQADLLRLNMAIPPNARNSLALMPRAALPSCLRPAVADGELFVCGRTKDLIIRQGKKYHPPDLESTIADVEGALYTIAAPSR